MSAANLQPGAAGTQPQTVGGLTPEQMQARKAGLGRLMMALSTPDQHQQENAQQNQQLPVPVAQTPATSTGQIAQQFR